MERETVLVTGSSGRIGTLLCNRLAARYRVLGFARDEARCPRSVSACISADLSSNASIRDAFARVRELAGDRLASVVHLAGYTSFTEPDDPRHEEVNIRGTERLLRELRSFRVEQLLFSSTMLVHRPCLPGERINEDWPLDDRPDWGYPRSKRDAEAVIRGGRGDIPVVLLRIAAVYDELCRLIPLARHIQRVYERQWTGHLFPGDLERGMTYLHIEDLLDALVRLVDRRADLPPELPLLVGEREPVTYQQLQDTLGRLIHGEEWATQEVPEGLARVGAWVQEKLLLGDDPFIKPWMIARADDHYALDTTRAGTLLEWQSRHTLREVLPEMVRRVQEDPAGWYAENGLEAPPAADESS